MSWLRKFWRDHRAEMDEAAFVIPVLLLVTFGLINFGMLGYASVSASNAANYGARMGSVAQAKKEVASHLDLRLQAHQQALLAFFIHPYYRLADAPAAQAVLDSLCGVLREVGGQIFHPLGQVLQAVRAQLLSQFAGSDPLGKPVGVGQVATAGEGLPGQRILH